LTKKAILIGQSTFNYRTGQSRLPRGSSRKYTFYHEPFKWCSGRTIALHDFCFHVW